jgi:hypothetical protein
MFDHFYSTIMTKPQENNQNSFYCDLLADDRPVRAGAKRRGAVVVIKIIHGI